MTYFQVLRLALTALNRERIDRLKKGSCMIAAEVITREFLVHELKGFEVFEGYLDFHEGLFTPEHTWIMFTSGALNGKYVDPTKGQFHGFSQKRMRYSRVKRQFTPEEYLRHCRKFPVDKQRYTLKN